MSEPNYQMKWRMWLLGMLSTELHVDLATLYGIERDPGSAFGMQMRGTIDSLALFDDGTRSFEAMNQIAAQALAELVSRFKPVVSRVMCEACDE